MLELCNYIFYNYPDLKNRIARWQLLSLLDKNEDKIIIVKENGKFKGSALYVKLTDETLWKLEWGFIDIKNPDDIKQMLSEKGNNIHFLYVLADNFKTIRKGLREAIKKENPKNVSWYNEERIKFFSIKNSSRRQVKILFVFYPLFVKFNHGIALLSSILKNKGIDAVLSMPETERQIKVDLDIHKPDYVGFSFVTDEEYKRSVPFIRLAKKLGYRILVGGVYPRREEINNSDIDYVCRGEGENLADFLLYRDTSIFDEQQLCKNINNLPLLDYELFGRNIWYKRDLPFLKNKYVIPYYTSRGCPNQCSFCAVRYQPKGVRIKNNFIEELEYLKNKYKPDAFFIGDELLPYYNKEWREQFSKLNYPFFAYIRADIEPQYLEFLAERGLKITAFGIESGNEKYRNEILNKNLYDKDIYRTIDLCKMLGIIYIPFYMRNTPEETEEIKQDTINMHNITGGMIWEYDELKKQEIVYK